MTVLFRCRVEKPILDKADQVTKKFGTSTPEMIRIFVAEIARTGKIPVSLGKTDDESVVSPWEVRAATLESFYDKSKTW